jgi:hypothetical protein
MLCEWHRVVQVVTVALSVNSASGQGRLCNCVAMDCQRREMTTSGEARLVGTLVSLGSRLSLFQLSSHRPRYNVITLAML